MFGEVLARHVHTKRLLRHDNGQGVSMTSFWNEFRPTMQSDPLTYLKIPILPSTFAATPSLSCINPASTACCFNLPVLHCGTMVLGQDSQGICCDAVNSKMGVVPTYRWMPKSSS